MNYWEPKVVPFVENSERHRNEAQLQIGEIVKVSEASETTSGFFAVDIRIIGGGVYEEVPYAGFFGFDYGTGNPHGVWVPPREGQMVNVEFYKGRIDMPQIISASPRPNSNENFETMRNFHADLTKDNMALYHYDGASVELKNDGGIKIEDNTGNTVEKMVKGETLLAKLEAIIDEINNITVGTGVGPSSTPINAPAFTAIKNGLSDILSDLNENN